MTNHIQLARSRMMLRHAFFASLLMSATLIEDPACPTAYTDMRNIYYNPKFLDDLNDKDVVMFVLAHEMMHIMLKHGLGRCQHRNPKIWNIACDFVINILLKQNGFKLWDQCYHDKFPYKWQADGTLVGTPVNWSGKGAEEIYDLIVDILKKDHNADPGGGGMNGDLHEAMVDNAERGQMEREINQKVAQAAMAAKNMGSMPGHLKHLVDGILNPPLGWRELLRDFATKVAPSDENWNHRNRRFANVYLPRRLDLCMGELIIIGDTSGSLIGSTIYAQTGVEINEIREQVKPERVRVIWADDDECSSEQIFEADEEVVLVPQGGGGTDMRKPLKHVEQFDPIVCILVTDCYTPWPDQPTPFPLIVLSNTDQKGPSWAQTIHIKDGGRP